MSAPKLWLFTPFAAITVALIAVTQFGGPGMDGAARSTAVLFWFFPLMIWLGYKSLVSLSSVSYTRGIKTLITLAWLIPSIPLALMSLFGLMLLSETGFGILK